MHSNGARDYLGASVAHMVTDGLLVAALPPLVLWLAHQRRLGSTRAVELAVAGERPGKAPPDVGDSVRFVSYAAWEDADAVRAWKRAPEFRDRLARVLQGVTIRHRAHSRWRRVADGST